MTKTPGLVGIAALVAVAGCQHRNGRPPVRTRELMRTSFEEQARGWAPEVRPTLTAEKAHTGKYSVRVDAHNQYSATYRAELGALCPSHRPRRFTLSAWVWVPSVDDDAQLILSITNPDNPEPVFRKALFVTDSGPFGAWKRVSRSLDLPSTTTSKSQLAITLWKSNANAPVYADDLQLTELW